MLTKKEEARLRVLLNEFKDACQYQPADSKPEDATVLETYGRILVKEFGGASDQPETYFEKLQAAQAKIVNFVQGLNKPQELKHHITLNKISNEEWMFRLQMFVIMMLETEKWMYSLHGNLKHEFKMRFNAYRTSTNGMVNFAKQHFDLDSMEDMGEVFSRVMEMLRRNDQESRVELFALLKAWTDNQINFIHEEAPKDHKTEVTVDLGAEEEVPIMKAEKIINTDINNETTDIPEKV